MIWHFFVFTLCISLMMFPDISFAQWSTVNSPDTASPDNIIAYSENSEGYRLEINKDIDGAIRSRFILKTGLISLSEDICPTYQIDSGMARNTSIDNTPCIFAENQSEYIIGKIINNRIDSTILVRLMNGITLTFRFRLQNGDYRETNFSLSGSKRSLTNVLGAQVTVNEI